MEDITTLWKCQETQSNAGVNNILKLLSEVGANGFNRAQLEHLFQLVRDSWCALDIQARLQFSRPPASGKMPMKHRLRPRLSITTSARHPLTEPSTIRNARHRLLNFVATTAITSREPWVSDLCLKLLWQLAHGLNSRSPDHAKAVISDTEEKSKASSGVRKLERFVCALSSGGNGGGGCGGGGGSSIVGNGMSVHLTSPTCPEHTEAAITQLVIVLRECRLPANEQRQRLNNWLSVTAEELKRDTLRDLNRTHSLIDTVCNSLHRLQKQASTSKYLVSTQPRSSTSSEPQNVIQHSDIIKRHLDVLQYLLSTADLRLSVERAQGIWDTLVNDFSPVLFDVEKTLRWFASAVELLETDAQNSIFTKHILKLSPSSIHTLKGFQSYEVFFVKVNLNEGRLKMTQDTWTVERMDLIGVDFLWDLYTCLPTPPKPTDNQLTNGPVDTAETKSQSQLSEDSGSRGSKEVPLELQIFERRQAVHKARKLLLLISWSQLSSKLKRDPESCHKRFFDYCRKRIELNLSSSLSEQKSPSVRKPSQASLRALLADTGQFLVSLLVGPKAAASARCRLTKASRLALYRLLYIVFSYIENAEDELIGAHEPPSVWKPHYMSFRGWELRIPLRVLSPSGQLLISSTLPLTPRCHTTSFGLCLSDATADALNNPILIVHSNATLASVRRQIALLIPVCLYALTNSTTRFAFGSEILALDPIKPPGVSGLHELTNRNRQAPLPDPKSETPLGHKLDREAVGELGFQTGRTLVIRLQPHVEHQGGGMGSGNASSVSISDGLHLPLLRRTSASSMKSGGSGKLMPPPPPNHGSSVSSSSFLPKVASFLHGTTEKQTGFVVDPGYLQSQRFTLPSLMLSANGSAYESLFSLAENDLAETGTAPTGPNLLHMTRLLLYCLPTYRPPIGVHASEKPTKGASGGGKSVSNSFAASMACTPQNLIDASQFRLLYLLQVLSGNLVARESSAWWECHAEGHRGVAQPDATPPSLSVQRRSLAEAEGVSGSRVVATKKSVALISSESCLNLPSTRLFGGGTASTSCPPSPEMVRRLGKKSTIGQRGIRWLVGGGDKAKDAAEHPVTLSKMSGRGDWLEPLVIILRKQLIAGTAAQSESVGLLVTDMLVRMVAPTENSQAKDSCRSDAWISREIKHCALQILATLLNPSSFNSPDNSECSSRASSFSSSCSSLTSFVLPDFAPKLLSVLMDTALASAAQMFCPEGSGTGGVVSARVGGSGGGGGMKRRRRGHLPIVESHAGVANALDPLASSIGFALTCQDVEIAVKSIQLLCQCVLSYPAQFMNPFLQMPDLKISLLRLLLHSPSLRIRSETCHQLEQLLYLSAGQHHQPVASAFGVEPCCQLFAWEVSPDSHSSRLPPYCFDLISVQDVASTPFVDLLLGLLFRAPRESTTGSLSNLLPPFWTTNQLSALADDEDRQALVHCAEFFRLRGRLFALVETSCLERFGGQNHTMVLEDEIRWFQRFAQAHSHAVSWSDVLLPAPDCALLNGHLKFLRVASTQMVAMVAARVANQSRAGVAACVAPASNATASAASAVWDEFGSARRGTSCQGLSPPRLLLGAGTKDRGNLVADAETTPVRGGHLSSAYLTLNIARPSASIDSKLAALVTNCIRMLADLVPTLLTDYMFPVANTILQEYQHCHTGGKGLHGIGSILLQPPPKRLNGNARQEAFILLLFLARMDLHSLEKAVNILIQLHHRDLPQDQSQHSRSPTPFSSLSAVEEEEEVVGGLTFNADATNHLPTAITWDYRPSLLGRAACNFTGLRNGGGTCYMNAVLQQLFMQPGVVEAILDVPTSKLDKDSLLYQTQELFLNLLFSQLQFYDPVGFWHSFRLWNTATPIDPHEQQDAFDFFQSLIDQLDEGMKCGEENASLPPIPLLVISSCLQKFNEVPFFSKIFHGILSDTMFCEDCGHRYDREQSFSAINLTVCTGDLLEEMRQYTREEVMDGDNAYFCERCQMRQRTLKRLAFSSLPPVLCLQLKRFGFDWERQVAVKSNQAFSFPRRLDMTPFVCDPSVFDEEEHVPAALNAPDSGLPRAGSGDRLHPQHSLRSASESFEVVPPSCVYELSGIVIHSGQAHAGHYYSFIRDRGRMEALRSSERKRSRSNSGLSGISGLGGSHNPIRKFLPSDTLTLGSEDACFTNGDATAPERWLKFNDTVIEEVEMTDDFLQQECFGGTYLVETPGRPPEKRTRNYSAYLLFYQRVPPSSGGSVCPPEKTRSRRTSEPSTKPRSGSALGCKKRRKSSTSGEKMRHHSTSDDGPINTAKASPDYQSNLASRGSHRSIQFIMPSVTTSSGTITTNRQPCMSLGMTPTPSKPPMSHTPLGGSHPSSTCLVGMVSGDAWCGNDAGEVVADHTGGGLTPTNEPTSADEMLLKIRSRNLAFLRDQSIFSADYVSFVHSLAQGVLADSTALQLEPTRAVLACQLVANFVFTTYLPLHASVKVAISPDLCTALLGLCAPPTSQSVGEAHHQKSTAELASLQEAGSKLDTHWLDTMLALMTANCYAVSWALGFFVRSPARPVLNYILACPKPLLRHQTARLVGVVLNTFFASKDASILDASLNHLIDYLLELLLTEVPQYAHQCGSYFGLMRGYVETCPHASVHLSNRSGTRRLLSFLVEEDAEHEETLSFDSVALSAPSSSTQNASSSKTGLLSIVVPSIISPQKDAGFLTWASSLRSWTVSQSKEMGNYYRLLAHMLLQSNFDQFRNSPLPATAIHASTRLRLFPRPETARWLGLSNLATSSDALSRASALSLPPQLRYVGVFLLVESLIRVYVENPHTPSPPQRQQQTGGPDAGKPEGVTSTHRASMTGPPDEMSLREVVVDVVTHLTQSWWVPSAAFISMVIETVDVSEVVRSHACKLSIAVEEHKITPSRAASPKLLLAALQILIWHRAQILSLIVTRPPVELRHYFDLVKQLLRIRDELQSARVLAVLCGLRGPVWRLRPDFQEGKMVDGNIFGDCGDAGDDIEATSRYPNPPDFAQRGLLVLITSDCSSLDSRRAYQCMKFLVELALENSAVVDGLSHFPELWGPAVEWLQSLLEASAPVSRATASVLSDSIDGPANGRRRSGTFGSAAPAGTLCGSTVATLTEAARMLATMPGYDLRRLQTHNEVDPDSPESISPPPPPS
ncbi:unnamed protein product [Mesocestoides corti]|uniref:ubiquitinyl hydrolase 1 n=1 Tax=Mesocestoides corti TaxID=53468 RepID=A0A0R3U306_MESCO|nr:unnamed protein product [Mesocestoides corti]